jgi:UDP-3-O-[3-hydroxymyristoyl] glucosamine N-acyltransferase
VNASAIARLLDVELQGGADPVITGAAPLDRAGPTDLSIVAKARYLPYVPASRAGLLLVSAELKDRVASDRPRIVLDSVYAALIEVLPRLYPESRPEAGVHPTAVVAADARVEPDVSIGPYAVIGAGTRIGARTRIGAHVAIGDDCVIDEDVMLYPHVVLYARTRIGARTIVHAGAKLGVDGFGYAPVGGVARKIPQVGECVVGADVEIGANVTIDRGSIGPTEIGDHVKIDNLTQIGHNVRIGAGTTIVAQVGISGSTRVGRGATIAGQAGVNGHIEIGDGATIAGQSGVFGDVPPGEVWSGYPARPHREALRIQASLFRVPELLKRIRALEREAEERQVEE